MSSSGPVGLADAIKALRAELQEAIAEGESSDVRFEVSSIELTLQAQVTKSGEGKAGVKWWLLEPVSASGSLQKATTQTIQLALKPVAVDDRGARRTVSLEGEDQGGSSSRTRTPLDGADD